MLNFSDQAYKDYSHRRQKHWDEIAGWVASKRGWSGAYHRRLAEIYRHLVPGGLRILEIGCGSGDLLAALQPAFGVGLELSPRMAALAKQRHPELTVLLADAHALSLDATFDVIILSDLLNDVWDVQTVFEEVRRLCKPNTRVITNCYSRLWEIPLGLAQTFGLAKPNLDQNWLAPEDVSNLLHLCGYDVIRQWPDVLFPLPVPLLSEFFNRFLGRIWPFTGLSLCNFSVSRLVPAPQADLPRVSVIVPARNEAGNVPDIFARVPEMGAGTELIFVEGHSSDDTYAAIEREMTVHPERLCKLFRQTGKGKGDAVRLGFNEAAGDILMILDADLTVPPEDLPRFYEALMSGKAEFANGVRLVYPMEGNAMRFLNLLGNKFFSVVFSWLLGQPIKDTLCGTKVLWKEDYRRIAENRAYFGDFDPFGDFDLIFGAARLSLKSLTCPSVTANACMGRPISTVGNTAGCSCAWCCMPAAGSSLYEREPPGALAGPSADRWTFSG